MEKVQGARTMQNLRTDALKKSLEAMKNSLISSYELKTAIREEHLFEKAWKKEEPDYLIFSDYRRNEGKRRILDAAEIIDGALQQLDSCDQISASKLYLQTLNAVALLTKWAGILESSVRGF
jgi:hypothetical protein